MKRIALCILALSFAWAYVQCTRAQESKTLDDFKREAVVEVDKSQKLIQEMVDSIFSFAERGFQEYETSKYLTGILEKNGFKVERNVADIPTAWVASYGSGKPVHSKKSILRMKTAFIDCAEANFLFVVAICIVLS
jgi:aminobenzoyl-glutamate utilization protein B